jgi:hypothetical protein
VRRFLKRTVQLGFLAGIGYAIWRYFDRQRGESEVAWEPQPFPYPPQPRSEAEATTAAPPVSDAPLAAPASDAPVSDGKAWVEAAEGTCPATHPVKAKLSSKIFHEPGGANYDRTKADRCYRDPAAAESDGLRKAAR